MVAVVHAIGGSCTYEYHRPIPRTLYSLPVRVVRNSSQKILEPPLPHATVRQGHDTRYLVCAGKSTFDTYKVTFSCNTRQFAVHLASCHGTALQGTRNGQNIQEAFGSPARRSVCQHVGAGLHLGCSRYYCATKTRKLR